MNKKFTGFIFSLLIVCSFLMMSTQLTIILDHSSEHINLQQDSGDSEEEELKSSIEDEYITAESFNIFSSSFHLKNHQNRNTVALPFISFLRDYPPPNIKFTSI